MALKKVNTLDEAKVKSTLDILVSQWNTLEQAQAKVNTTLWNRWYDVWQTIQPVIQPKTQIEPAKTNFEPIDTTTGQPVTPVIPTEPTINEPVVNEPIKTEQKINEPVKTETTTWTTTWIETPTVDLTKIQTVDDWKKQTGGWMNNLESWVEKAYWTTATQENGKLTAEVNGKKYEWTIDEAWNPNKKEITLSPQQLLQDKIRKIKFNKYSSLPDQQLQTSLANWSLVPWTQSYNDLMLDPNQKARIQKLEKLNLIAWKNPTQEQILDNASNDIANNTNITVWWQEMTLAQAMKDWTINQDEFNQMTNNSQITTKAEEVEDLANDLARQRADYEAIKKATEEELRGSWASMTAINQLIADRQESLLWPLNLAITDYNNALWTLTELKKSSADLFALNYDSYKTQEQRTYDEQLAQKQLQQKFDYEYWDLNSTDPNVQRVAAERIAQAVQTQYAWLMFRRSVPEMSQDILNELASWKTMWEISTEITNAIQNSPTYNEWAMNKWLITKPEVATQDWSKLDDKTLYNEKTGEVKTIWDGWWPASTTTTDWLTVTAWTTKNRPDRNNNPWNVKIWDVWYWVDDQNHTIFWNPTDWYNAMVKDITAKLTWWSSRSSKLTGKKLWPNSTLADLWSVYAEDPKWSDSVSRLSWYSKTTLLKNIDVNKLAPAIAKQEWFTWTIKNTPAWTTTLTDADISRFNNTTFKPDNLKTDSDKQKYQAYQDKINTVYNNPNSNFYDVISLSQWSGKWSVSEREKVWKYSQVLGGLDTLTGLVSSKNTWPIAWRLMQLNPYSTDVAEFKAVIAWLVPTVARWIFNEVWVLTDTDIQNYLKTLPTLEKTQDQNKLVVWALLKTLRNWMKWQLDTMARSKVDVSNFVWSIKKMDATISNLEKAIWTATKTKTPVKTQKNMSTESLKKNYLIY